MHSASWYSTPSGKVGCRFTAVLAAEWRGFLDRNWNSEIRLIFAHVSLIKTLGARKSREIRAMIGLRLDLRWGVCWRREELKRAASRNVQRRRRNA